MKPWQHKLASAVGAGVLFAIMAAAITRTTPWQEVGAGGAEDIAALAQALFSDYVIALEVLGVLLTAAMIGAMVIARPLGVPLDRQHYPDVADELLARSMDVSDIQHPAYLRGPVAVRPEAPPAGASVAVADAPEAKQGEGPEPEADPAGGEEE